jgi:hypothetical protein
MRYMTTVESAAAVVGSTAPSGSTANSLFAAFVGSTSLTCKVRRITIGVRAGTGAPTSQQMTVALIRTTARGTATGTNAPKGLDPGISATASSPGVDTAWSTPPTATWTAPYFYEVSFNTQAAVDLPFELLEELLVPAAASNANGMAFYNVGNALPASHLYTLSIEHEE